MSSLEADIKNINTLFAKATTISIIVGAAIGGLFLLGGSVELAVAFNGVTYLVSAFSSAALSFNTCRFSQKT